jgi:hypothetical protein
MTTSTSNDKLLKIYLQDHHAGSVAGRELARRCLSSNAGTPLGNFLTTFISEITEDAATLVDVMARLGTSPDRAKNAGVWAIEKIGRLKLNGQVRGYSPLSRLVELEGLSLGVEAKIAMWKVLREVAETDDRLRGIDFEALLQRGMRQREELEGRRKDAAVSAFEAAEL